MALLHKPLVDGIRAIAIYEEAKGALVLAAGFGLLGLNAGLNAVDAKQ